MTTAINPADIAASMTDDQLVQAVGDRLLDMVSALARSVSKPDEARVGYVIVQRRELPPVSAPRGAEINQYDVYATVECGELRAEIARYAAWDPRDGDDAVRVAFDAKINGLRQDGGGVAEIYATDSFELFELAQIAVQTALLLGEARRS